MGCAKAPFTGSVVLKQSLGQEIAGITSRALYASNDYATVVNLLSVLEDSQ